MLFGDYIPKLLNNSLVTPVVGLDGLPHSFLSVENNSVASRRNADVALLAAVSSKPWSIKFWISAFAVIDDMFVAISWACPIASLRLGYGRRVFALWGRIPCYRYFGLGF